MRKKKIQNSLNLAHDMYEEGKLSESLEILNSLEPVDNFSEHQKVIFYTIYSKNYIYSGNYPKAYEMAEKGMHFANKIEKCIEVADAFLNMAFILSFLGKKNESMNLMKEISEILQNLTNISEKDRKRRMGLIYLYKGRIFFYLGESIKSIENLKDAIDLLEKWGSRYNVAIAYAFSGGMYQITGEYNKALLSISKSQKICENKESIHFVHPKWLNNMISGIIYWNKGELHLALDFTKKAVSLGRKHNILSFIMLGLINLGRIYQELGEWEHAIDSIKEALSIAEETGSNFGIIDALDCFFQVYINIKDLDAAQQIFHRIEQIRDSEKENKRINLFYQIDRAILMKMSKRTRDLGVAQDIFKNIIKEEVIEIGFTQMAVLNLCEMLLDEFKETKNAEALDEFSSLLKPLQEAAKKQHSYPLLAKTYLLEAKLSMINFDLKKARQSLTKAQQIAERYGLGLLAIKISNEHDKLLQNLEVWDKMRQENVPISERLEKIDINDQISIMLKKKPVEIPETSPESPILLLIMAKSGIPLYTKIFNNEWKINEELFSGFLSAFNSFSDEIFSEGLDRANFGKFTILMTGMPPFMSCYVFEGQSFLAHQKFSKFNETINESDQIWKILTSSNRTGLVIKDDASEGLGKLVKTIF